MKTWHDFTPKYRKELSQYQEVLEAASAYYICTTKWPVLRLPEAASRTAFVLPSG